MVRYVADKLLLQMAAKELDASSKNKLDLCRVIYAFSGRLKYESIASGGMYLPRL